MTCQKRLEVAANDKVMDKAAADMAAIDKWCEAAMDLDDAG